MSDDENETTNRSSIQTLGVERMKRLTVLLTLFLPAIAFGQVTQGALLITDGMGWLRVVSTKSGGAVDTAYIHNRTFTGITADTTNAVNVLDASEVWLILSAADSATVLPKYQLSNDAKNWRSAVSTDSLKADEGVYEMKAINVSTPADSAAYIRFILTFDTKAYAKGTTSPTYDARVKKQ
jgi:hypothetical protein